MLSDIRPQLRQRLRPADHWRFTAKQLLIHLRQQIRIVISLPAQHHPIKRLQMFMALLQRLDAAVENNLQRSEVLLQLRRHVIAQGWNVAVLLWRQPFQNRNPSMHRKTAAARVLHRPDKVTQLGITVPPIDPDTVLDRHRNRHRIAHRLHTIGHQGRVSHQDRADHIVLHPVARAADIQVHFVVASGLGHTRTGGQVSGDTAAKLERQRVLGFVMAQEAVMVAMQDCAGGDHLGVEQGVFGEQAQEEPAVTVGPVHHGCNAKAPRQCGA